MIMLLLDAADQIGICGRKPCKKVNLRSGTVERKPTEK